MSYVRKYSMSLVAVISGGSSGIGLACVHKFLQNEYLVYNLDIMANNIQHANYHYIETDMRNSHNIQQAVKHIIVEGGQVDTLILSAGKHLSAPIADTTSEQLMELMTVNVFGAFWLIQAIIPHMVERQRGTIITLGSDQSTIAKNNSAVYGMTKSALTSLTKNIAIDYGKFNVRANCIGAGTIDTPLTRNALTQHSKQSGIPVAQLEREENMLQVMGRIGKPSEVAELAYFLSQDSVAYINGALIPIDGGYIAR